MSISGADPARSAYSALFVLGGSAAQGWLELSTPLGVMLAQVQWHASGASVLAQGQTRHYPDMATLTTELTGTALPLAALFAWLRGEAVQEDGWQPDLSDWPHGRLRAQRLQPAAQLRLALDEAPARAE
ncbi:MAG: lipoprotein insertase outer membrane protein LolB [Rhodoferax sp.]